MGKKKDGKALRSSPPKPSHKKDTREKTILRLQLKLEYRKSKMDECNLIIDELSKSIAEKEKILQPGSPILMNENKSTFSKKTARSMELEKSNLYKAIESYQKHLAYRTQYQIELKKFGVDIQ